MAQDNLFDLNIPAADLQAVQEAIQVLATRLAPQLCSATIH